MHFQQIMTEILVRDENVTVGILGEDPAYSVYYQNIPFELMIMPQAPVIVTDEDMTATLSYNVQYNLTVLGSLCGYTLPLSLGCPFPVMQIGNNNQK